jgi:hypothetical protein
MAGTDVGRGELVGEDDRAGISEPLSRQVGLLGELLGDAIRAQAGLLMCRRLQSEFRERS